MVCLTGKSTWSTHRQRHPPPCRWWHQQQQPAI